LWTVRIEVIFVEIQRFTGTSSGMPEGQLADTAYFLHKQWRIPVVKDIYLVIGVVRLSQVTNPGQFRFQVFRGHSLTQGLRFANFHFLIHKKIELKAKSKK
jgi:hypothetical protein